MVSSYVHFHFIPSSCNMVGSCLAKEAFNFTSCKTWIGVGPDFLLTAVQVDLL